MINIPNYAIGKMVGRGGVAEVYVATHKLLNRTVAIKIISPAKAGEAGDKRFLKEAQVLAGLRHANIVSIYDVGVLEGKYYFIMEYLDGGDLKDKIRKGLSVGRSVEILQQIGSALAHAHDRGFIHRDIKSQNIMFRSDDTAVLTDFGIVKDLTSDAGYTMDGTSIGTPHYMSPEQAQGESSIDWRTDLYSLGVTFYEMLTGDVPFTADSAVAVALRHIKDPIPKLPEHFSRYQPIIDRLMAKKPEKRYQSAHELLEKLEHFSLPEEEATLEETMEFTRSHALRREPVFKGLKPILFLIPLLVVLLAGALIMLRPLDLPLLKAFISPEATVDENSQTAARGDRETLGVPAREGTGSRAENTAKPSPEAASRQKSMAAPDISILEGDKLRRMIADGEYAEAIDSLAPLRGVGEKRKKKLFKKAEALVSQGLLVDAADVYNTLLAAGAENRFAYAGLLTVAIRMQQDLETHEEPSREALAGHLRFLADAVSDTGSAHFQTLREKTLDLIYNTSRKRYSGKAYEAALALCRTGLEYAPEDRSLQTLALLCQAGAALEKWHLTLPEGESALSYYRQVLAMDRENQEARQGLTKITARLADAARSAYEKGDYDKALLSIEKARGIDPENQAAKLFEWLVRGDRAYARGSYTSPENASARYYYQKILQERPGRKDISQKLARAKIMGVLAAMQEPPSPATDLHRFRQAFETLKSAEIEHGRKPMADLRQRVVAIIESVIEAGRAGKRELPEDFRQLVTSYYPAFDSLFRAQYETLVEHGDNADDPEKKAAFYLEAVSMKPASRAARDKLLDLAKQMEAAGRPATVALLKKAAAAAPDDPRFSELLETARAARDARAEIFTALYEIKLVEPFSAKVEPYGRLFRQIEDATLRYGKQRMADPREETEEQVRADIAALQQEDRLIPETFLEMAAVHMPGLEKFLHQVQYNTLIAKAEDARHLAAAADYYVAALKINPHRPEASEAIRDLALTAEAGGDYRLASRVLDEARAAAPTNGMIADIHDAIRREIRIYPTHSGCDAEAGLEEAPVTTESLTICLEYRNLAPNTIVQVALAGPNGQSLELPVVLEGRSGSQAISVAAPVEGFAVGSYEITARQDRAAMAQSRIRFIPKRR